MGECKLDHSVEDVQKKLAEQSPFLPQEMAEQLRVWLETGRSQEERNELFHLLKKYDLATPEERAEREAKMALLLG